MPLTGDIQVGEVLGYGLCCSVTRVQEAPIDEGVMDKGLQHGHDAVLVGSQHAHDILARRPVQADDTLKY